MSGYDYASELIGGSRPAASTPNQPLQQASEHDYATELVGPRTTAPATQAGRTDSFSRTLQQRKAELEGGASFGASTQAAMVDDPKTKIKILAANIFPGDPDAVERFGELKGEIVYVGKDDKLYKAEPSGIKSFAANVAGNLPTIAGGTAGAVIGAAGGPLASAGLGALGAAGGKGVQEIIANVALDEPQTPAGNIAGMAKEAAFAGVGGLGGAVFQKWIQRNMARDISKFDPSAVADLDAKAAAIGVDSLNAAQRTNVPSLKGRVEALARIPSSADDMNVSLETTRQKAGAAAERYVSGVQRTTGTVREAGESGRSGATHILDRIAEDRSTAARPHYQRAFETAKIDSRDETLQRLMGTDAFKKGYERAVRIAKNEGIDLGDEKNNMRVLHYVKMGIDDLLDQKVMAKEGIGSTEQRGILMVKNRLLQVMDSASPDYARGRAIYAHYMPTLKAQREGTLGQLADLADEDLNTASRIVFSPQNSPEDVRKLRSLFFRHDQGEQWKALTKGYLQDSLETASKEFKSGPGAGKAVTWRYMMLGDPKQASNLRSAMTEDQWRGFNDMMDVFEAVGRTKGTGNSITMPMQEAAAELRRESGSGLIGAALQPRQKVINWLEEARLGKYAAKQVEILNDPGALEKLKELRRLSPNDQKFIQGFSTLFGVSASPE